MNNKPLILFWEIIAISITELIFIFIFVGGSFLVEYPFFVITSIIGIIMSIITMREVKVSAKKKGVAISAMILSLIFTLINLLWIVVIIIIKAMPDNIY